MGYFVSAGLMIIGCVMFLSTMHTPSVARSEITKDGLKHHYYFYDKAGNLKHCDDSTFVFEGDEKK